MTFTYRCAPETRRSRISFVFDIARREFSLEVWLFFLLLEAYNKTHQSQQTSQWKTIFVIFGRVRPSLKKISPFLTHQTESFYRFAKSIRTVHRSPRRSCKTKEQRERKQTTLQLNEPRSSWVRSVRRENFFCFFGEWEKMKQIHSYENKRCVHSPSNQSTYEAVVFRVEVAPLFQTHQLGRRQGQNVVQAVLARFGLVFACYESSRDVFGDKSVVRLTRPVMLWQQNEVN